jgi:hypothetical protein
MEWSSILFLGASLWFYYRNKPQYSKEHVLGKACSIHGAKRKIIRISAVTHNGKRLLLRGRLKSEGGTEIDNSCPSASGKMF